MKIKMNESFYGYRDYDYDDGGNVDYEREEDGLYVCDHCFQAIESHEGRQDFTIYYPDEDDEQDSFCNWCEESGFDKLYHVR